jgi:hypothetical protein
VANPKERTILSTEQVHLFIDKDQLAIIILQKREETSAKVANKGQLRKTHSC